jgi:hypothetical protein
MSTALPVWQILALIGVFLVATLAWGWFRDQYEPVWTGRLPRFTRRWYGLRAHVRIRSEEGHEIPDLFEVVEWGDDSTEVPWLCVRTVGDENAVSFWAPVTGFTPVAVRRLRPPFSYAPLPEPARAGDGA